MAHHPKLRRRTQPLHLTAGTLMVSQLRRCQIIPKKLRQIILQITAGRIAEEVVQHLVGLLGADVEITLEIHANIPDGAPDNVVRTVTENCRTLRFKTFGFESE